MLKRLIVACVLAICLALLCTVGIYVAKNLSAEFENLTQSALENARKGNFKTAIENMKTMQMRWTKYEPLMAVFFNSDSLHSIEGTIYYVSTLAEQESDDFIPEAVLLSYSIRRIKMDEILSVESWF